MAEQRGRGRRRGRRRALRRSEENFRLLVDSVLDYAIFMLDRDGIVATWNAGAQRLKGYREDEIVGRHYATFYPEEYRAAGLPEELLERARTEGRAKHSGWRVRKDGTRFWADVVITALHDDTGQHTGFAKVTRDMTEAHAMGEAREAALEAQADAVARLRELDRWRRDFIGAVVHDLQNPVTAILGFAGLLDADTPAEERADLVERIRSNARSLQHLIGNLRSDTTLSEGRVRLDRTPVQLDAFVAQLLADLAPIVADHELVLDIPPVEVVVDPHALERILRNLIGNAARHTPPGTRIAIRARSHDGNVTVEVADEGEGIPDAALPDLFERFVAGRGTGMGLGLSVARRYVELHGGGITAENPPTGGAVFRFTLPHPVG